MPAPRTVRLVLGLGYCLRGVAIDMKRLEEIAYFVADLDGAVKFYERVLGLKPARWTPGKTAEFPLGDAKLFLHVRGTGNEDHIAFAVDDLDNACEELQAQGVRIETGPKDFYWGRSAYLRDPDGRLVELHRASAAKGP